MLGGGGGVWTPPPPPRYASGNPCYDTGLSSDSNIPLPPHGYSEADKQLCSSKTAVHTSYITVLSQPRKL